MPQASQPGQLLSFWFLSHIVYCTQSTAEQYIHTGRELKVEVNLLSGYWYLKSLHDPSPQLIMHSSRCCGRKEQLHGVGFSSRATLADPNPWEQNSIFSCTVYKLILLKRYAERSLLCCNFFLSIVTHGMGYLAWDWIETHSFSIWFHWWVPLFGQAMLLGLIRVEEDI